MIITVNELRQFVTTTETNQVLEFKIQALESFICQYTNNSFVNRSTGEKDYPPDIKMGVINLMKWEQEHRDKIGIQSETISRHSVTYADAKGENFIGGYPAMLVDFLKPYMKARF